MTKYISAEVNFTNIDINTLSEVSLSIRNQAMQFKSEFEKSQSFGVARKQSEIVRVGMRVRRTMNTKNKAC